MRGPKTKPIRYMEVGSVVWGPGEGKLKTGARRGERLEQRAEPKPELMQARVVATTMRSFLDFHHVSMWCYGDEVRGGMTYLRPVVRILRIIFGKSNDKCRRFAGR